MEIYGRRITRKSHHPFQQAPSHRKQPDGHQIPNKTTTANVQHRENLPWKSPYYGVETAS